MIEGVKGRVKILLSYPSEHDKIEDHSHHRGLPRLGHEVVVPVNVAASAVAPGGRLVVGYPMDVSIQDLLRHHHGADLFLCGEPLGLNPPFSTSRWNETSTLDGSAA
jgi:hypothetical protein